MSEKTGTHISEVTTMAIPVDDQDRALEFYVGTLGFEKRRDASYGPGQRWIEVAPPGATTTIALVPRQGGAPMGIRFMTEDANADHANLLGRGVDADAQVMRMGGPMPPMFTFRDPDGNNFVIIERMPVP